MSKNTPLPSEPRAQFATKIGVIATAVGSAVGLGNIWRFPYEAGTHGGGAFLLCYVGFIFLLGIPLLCAEFLIGRATRSNEIKAFKKLSPKGRWYFNGYLGILASILILSFYSVVAGWTLEYLWLSMSGSMTGDADILHGRFDAFISGDVRPLMWTLLFLALNYIVVARGVQKGIERISNLLMPAMTLLLVAFCINSLFLPGAADGLSYLFSPDFSKITPRMLLSAMGQAFFSLSLGLGCMLTYGSYFPASARIGRSATTTAILDTLVAVLAGIIIFPAVFTYGISPQAGPTLVFETLPAIFMNLPGGVVWSLLFFFLLFMASITSTISMGEISIAWLVEERRLNRKVATAITVGSAMVLGSVCALSFGCLRDFTLFGMTAFDLFDYVSSNICLPVGGMVLSIFTGWVIDRKVIRDQLTNDGSFRFRMLGVIVFLLRFVCPVAILLIMLNSIGII